MVEHPVALWCVTASMGNPFWISFFEYRIPSDAESHSSRTESSVRYLIAYLVTLLCGTEAFFCLSLLSVLVHRREDNQIRRQQEQNRRNCLAFGTVYNTGMNDRLFHCTSESRNRGKGMR